MVDPRWMVLIVMVAFYFYVGNVAYNGRRVATASQADRPLQLEHHTDSLWQLLCAAILLLVVVLMVVNLSVGHERSALFWVHESLDATFLLLVGLALYFNGNHNINGRYPVHRYLGWSMVALTIPIGITGGILLYHLPIQIQNLPLH